MTSQPTTRVEALLHDLCVTYGYCLGPDERAALVAEPPPGVNAFVDAVLVAEGADPRLCDRQTRHALADLVRDWLHAADGRGARSGLR